jgi:hypothetical protein
MVSPSTIRRRKRFADPEYRKQKCEESRAHWAARKDEVNARKRAEQVHLKHRYGMSPLDYDALLALQGGVCAICKKKSKRRLVVDHCHSRHRVRGLLCHKCNLGLGMFDDDIERLRSAIAYLERSRREPTPDTESSDDPGAADRHLVHKQKGNRMTQDEAASPLGAKPPPELALDLVADAPSIAPEQEGGGARPARERDALAGAEFAPLDLAELLALDIPERGMVLDPIIPEKGLALLYAVRGTGKTHVALGIAHAVATGGTFLNWRAPQPRRVLLVDGEMPVSDLRDRLRCIVAGTGVAAAAGMLKVLAGDLLEDGVGDLAHPQVQRKVERCLDGAELLILDNLASLMPGQRESDTVGWTTMQQWLLRLRRRGVSVLVVHHAGKNGEQRGVSNREDLLDTSISLRRPSDYSPAEGARFEVHVAKGRGLRGAPALPFEAMLATRQDMTAWTVKPIEDVERTRVAALLADGLSIRDIAEETGIARSTVHRLKKKLERDAETEAVGTGKIEPAQ